MTRTITTSRAGCRSLTGQCPAIAREREHELAQRWRQNGDTSARDLLVRGQLRHVVAIARGYRRYGCVTLEELIAEGNFGLVRALAKFDPERGTRFVTYAAYWIRAYISQYLLRSRSLVSTGVQSKVLSKIRRAREDIVSAQGERGDVNGQIAERLDLSHGQLHSLLERMDVHDVSWDETAEDAPGGPPSQLPQSPWLSAEEKIISSQTGEQLSKAVSQIVSKLDERERYIIERRLMAQHEDALTLAEIGRRFGVSRERARQLEARAMQKVKVALSRASLGAGWLTERHAA